MSGGGCSEVMRMTLNCIYSLELKITAYVHAKSLQSCLTLQTPRLLCPWNSPSKIIEVGCHFLLQGIFLTQGSNPCLLHWQVYSLLLSHQGSPRGLIFIVIDKILKLQWAVVLTDMPVTACISGVSQGEMVVATVVYRLRWEPLIQVSSHLP